MADTYQKINATVKTFLASYQAAFQTKDAKQLSTTLTSDCSRTMQPKAFAEILGLQHNPVSVAGYEAIVQGEPPALEVGQINLEKLMIDTEKKAASLKVSIHAEFKGRAKDILEFILFLDFTESCDQVMAVVQFADTANQ